MDRLDQSNAGIVRVPNLDTLADYIDRLIVEVNKLAFFENRKRQLQLDPGLNAEEIVRVDNLSRDCCELRSMLKNRINELFESILRGEEYLALREVRTFRPPAARLADALADRCHDIGNLMLQGRILEALRTELGS